MFSKGIFSTIQIMTQSILPNHIAIIPDGNRRWAKGKNLPTLEGHRRGFDTAVKLSKYLRKKGVHTLTLWGFSTENWTREKDEVSYLMRLYGIMLDKYLAEALKDNVRVTHLGRRDRLPKNLLKKIEDLEKKTRAFSDYYLNIALDYGGHDEVIRAIQKMSDQKFNPYELSENNFNQFLDTHDQQFPTVDLIIRTSGEYRTSGLMIWQAAYAEYIFSEKYFPDLNEEDMDSALEEYANRQRRFGK